MQQNTIYRQVYRRDNVLFNFILGVFITFSSWFRLLLEVIIRKNMGERYFKLSSAISVAVVMFFFPLAAEKLPFLYPSRHYYGHPAPSLWSQYWAWYMYLVAFVAGTYLRWREVKRNPSVFNGGRATIYTGDIHPVFFEMHPLGRRLTTRQVECFFEPAAFFFVGYFLNLFGQKLGILFMVSSTFYALSYVGMYRKADDYIMDILDEQVYASEMENVIVNDAPNNAKGVRVHGTKPADKVARKKLADTIKAQFDDVSYVD